MNETTIIMTLRDLCVKNNWFNAGTNTQYDKMFELAKDLVALVYEADPEQAIHRLTGVIWVCTDGKSYESIYKELRVWFKEAAKGVSTS